MSRLPPFISMMLALIACRGPRLEAPIDEATLAVTVYPTYRRKRFGHHGHVQYLSLMGSDGVAELVIGPWYPDFMVLQLPPDDYRVRVRAYSAAFTGDAYGSALYRCRERIAARKGGQASVDPCESEGAPRTDKPPVGSKAIRVELQLEPDGPCHEYRRLTLVSHEGEEYAASMHLKIPRCASTVAHSFRGYGEGSPEAVRVQIFDGCTSIDDDTREIEATMGSLVQVPWSVQDWKQECRVARSW